MSEYDLLPLTEPEAYILMGLAQAQHSSNTPEWAQMVGAEIGRMVERDSDGAVRIQSANLYPMLRRLSASGLLHRHQGIHGRSDLYAITEIGMRALSADRRRLEFRLMLMQAGEPQPSKAGDKRLQALPDDIREQGWMLAVHNDYRLHGNHHTFWLFTKNGRAVKGEGRTDAAALNEIRAHLARGEDNSQNDGVFDVSDLETA